MPFRHQPFLLYDAEFQLKPIPGGEEGGNLGVPLIFSLLSTHDIENIFANPSAT